jgi:leucyl/phenylalanyl-tRNA---protein transferase
VSIGRLFAGESMFSFESNASKIALAHLVERLKGWGFTFIDSQVITDHLASLGASEIPRSEYLKELSGALKHETIRGNWGGEAPCSRG